MDEVVFSVDAIVKDLWALKAFYVSCARDGGVEARIHFSEVRTVKKEVVLNELPTSSGSVESAATRRYGLPDGIDMRASTG
ncbi:hypothetical protein DFH11DRAFT_1647716 [Phellopilus nigrolimitatus]|nr:hypothetical protein DFH11DRAFT_1647716 [Phellopilus nigrolimitatus]